MNDVTEMDLQKPTVLDQSTTITGDESVSGGDTSTAAATAKFIDSLPEEYRAKEWVANLDKHLSSDPNLNPVHELVKMFDNQQSLVGRKTEGLKVPGEGAKPEDWTEFYKQIGVPDSPEKYEYKLPEVQEHLKPFFAEDQELMSAMKAAAIKAGVRPEGFAHLADAFNTYYLGELEKQTKTLNETLSTLESGFKQKYGDKSDQVLAGWQQSLASAVGNEQAAILEQLDPRVKLVMAEHYHSFAQKYIREDSMNLDVPSSGAPLSQQDYDHRYGELFAKQLAAEKSHGYGSAEYQQVAAEITKLREVGKHIFANK